MPRGIVGFSGRRVWAVLLAAAMAVPFAGLAATLTARTAGAAPAVTNYPGSGISSPYEITAGPDGALWFVNGGNRSIGRVTTTGAVTNYTGNGISIPASITAGPDGALWFTDSFSIGRITTTRTITSYADANLSLPRPITAGPD